MNRGRLVLMGSGETAPSMVATHRDALLSARAERVTILDTPYGFQENADQLTARLAGYFRTSLSVETEVATLRRPDASPLEVERMLAAVRRSRYVFAGPGSPSYAVGIWRPIGLAEALVEVVEMGGTVTLASAAALTAGVSTLPVYEIYKVGQEPHWLEGLDLTGRLGFEATVIPHWNNSEGGNHDTSRCYIGERRLRRIEDQLETGILGIDEHTAATLDFSAGRLTVTGAGSVTLRGEGGERVVESGGELDLDEAAAWLGEPAATAPPPPPEPAAEVDVHRALEEGKIDIAVAAMLRLQSSEESAAPARLRAAIVELGESARFGLADPRDTVGGFVDVLLDVRERARRQGRFDEADFIRDRLGELGVEVRDTAEGPEWHLTLDPRS